MKISRSYFLAYMDFGHKNMCYKNMQFLDRNHDLSILFLEQVSALVPTGLGHGESP